MKKVVPFAVHRLPRVRPGKLPEMFELLVPICIPATEEFNRRAINWMAA